jgi:hypothetical protein
VFSRRPGARFNRGRVAAQQAAGSAAWSPAQLSTGVEYWLIEDLVSLGEGTVAPSWSGRQLGATFTPPTPDTDIGTVRLTAFLGDVATQKAGLRMAARGGITTNATVCGVFNGTNKLHEVWMIVQLNSSVTNQYWSAGNQVATTEYIQARYAATGTIKNNVAMRDGVLNVVDNFSEIAVMSPQLLRWKRGTGSIYTLYRDEISEGNLPARVDAGIAIDQFCIGMSGAGANGGAKNSSMDINAIGIVSGAMTAQDIANLAAWAYPRVGLNWKKALNP